MNNISLIITSSTIILIVIVVVIIYFSVHNTINASTKNASLLRDTSVAVKSSSLEDNILGTAFIIDTYNGELILATATHVISSEGLQYQLNPPVQNNLYITGLAVPYQYPVRVIGSDVQSDISFLITDGGNFSKNQKTLQLKNYSVNNGESIYSSGYPLNLYDNSFSEGVIRDKSVYSPNTLIYNNTSQQFMSTNPIDVGSSGSPVVKSSGNVIGMSNWKLSTNGTFVGGPTSTVILETYKKIKELNTDFSSTANYNSSTGKGGIGLDYWSPLIGNVLIDIILKYPNMEKYNKTEGIVIDGLYDSGNGTGLLNAGLQIGDIILSIDGKVISNRTGFDINDIYFSKVNDVNVKYIRPSDTNIVEKEVTVKVGISNPFNEIITFPSNAVPVSSPNKIFLSSITFFGYGTGENALLANDESGVYGQVTIKTTLFNRIKEEYVIAKMSGNTNLKSILKGKTVTPYMAPFPGGLLSAFKFVTPLTAEDFSGVTFSVYVFSMELHKL